MRSYLKGFDQIRNSCDMSLPTFVWNPSFFFPCFTTLPRSTSYGPALLSHKFKARYRRFLPSSYFLFMFGSYLVWRTTLQMKKLCLTLGNTSLLASQIFRSFWVLLLVRLISLIQKVHRTSLQHTIFSNGALRYSLVLKNVPEQCNGLFFLFRHV